MFHSPRFESIWQYLVQFQPRLFELFAGRGNVGCRLSVGSFALSLTRGGGAGDLWHWRINDKIKMEIRRKHTHSGNNLWLNVPEMGSP